MLIRIEYLMGESIDGNPVSNSNSVGCGGIFRVGSYRLVVVIGSVSSAVSLIPAAVGHCVVPSVVNACAVGQVSSGKAGTEAGGEESGVEVNVDEVDFGVIVFEVKALEIAVVPGDVGVGSAGKDNFLLGGVPVFVVSDEGG